MQRLFAYGTLTDPEICGGLLGRMPTSIPAVLRGYARHDVRGEAYPAIVPQHGGSVRGRLYGDLSAGDLALLDAYEGDEYSRSRVEVDTGQERVTAWAYVWQADPERLET
jgi:gamma-glutamylcyclotransferase (GGCT)/AIG2-like uncharacterized protein YtfP